jgi:MFS transporter, ACS family, D-galactonate transporter
MSARSPRSTGVENQARAIRPDRITTMAHMPTPKGAWLIVALLFLFMMINFADKAVLGIAAVPIMQELRLSPSEFGLIGSSFFLLFALSAIITGFVANRMPARWLLAGMGLVWALSQFPMTGATGFGTLLACRIALGAGEGPAGPVALHATYKWFANERRTLPTAVIAQGGGVGIMVAVPALNWVIVRYSWHWAFGVLGIAGLAWTALWLALGREGSLVSDDAPAPAPSPRRVSYGRLVLNPTTLASWCASFGANWGLSQALSWQGAFLIKGLGLTQAAIGLLGPLPAAASVVAMIAAGWYSQHLLARGSSSRVARGILGGSSVVVGGVALALMPAVHGIAIKIALTTIGLALPSVVLVISNAVVAEITPTAQRGALLAIGGAVGTSAGLLAPYVTGRLVESAASPLDGFNTGFVVCGVIMLVGGAIGMALIRPEREAIRWASEMPQAAVGSA